LGVTRQFAALLALPAAGLFSGCRPAARAAAAPVIRFEETALRAGLRFQWKLPDRSPLSAPETFGCGCGLLDYDRDGHLDVLLVGEPRCALFRGRGDGTFVDVTAETGLRLRPADWKGCAVGDYDGDGWPDLYLTGFHDAALLRNDRGRRWEERTGAAGVRNTGWGSSAGFADLDHDGDLDLFVGNYVHFGPGSQKYCDFPPGVRTACPPHYYQPDFGRLFRNDGKGRFTDVSRQSGVRGGAHGNALAVGFCDANADGKTDFYVANDGKPCDLFLNQGGLRFRNIGEESGTAYDSRGHTQAGMCVDFADYDRDGWIDLVVSAFSGEFYSLYRNREGRYFNHESVATGLAAATRHRLGFGGRFLDVDNDGWQDLLFANGHVYDQAEKIEPGVKYRQPLLLLRNREGTRFEDIGASAGEAFARLLLGRGLATGDIDNDGRVDALVVDYGGRPILLMNRSSGGHWISLSLEGTRGNPAAFGARVSVRAGGAVHVREVSAASSYLSSSDPRAHFGLGETARADEVEVRWPDGRVERHRDLPADRAWRLRPGAPPEEVAP